jgi:hypothetical protein
LHAASELVPLQTWPAAVQNRIEDEEEAAQQGWPGPPQLPQAPKSVSEHLPSVAPQLVPAATQLPLAQQADPAQLRLSQQGCPGWPHALSVPSRQTVAGAEPCAPCGMQSLRPGSAQPPATQGTPLAQGALPSAPQLSTVFSATHSAPLEVSWPMATQLDPEQQPFTQPLLQQG